MPGSLFKNFTMKFTKNIARKRSKTLKGGCSTIGAAVLPFGLLGLQKYFQSNKKDVPSYYRKRKESRYRKRRRSKKQMDESV